MSMTRADADALKRVTAKNVGLWRTTKPWRLNTCVSLMAERNVMPLRRHEGREMEGEERGGEAVYPVTAANSITVCFCCMLRYSTQGSIDVSGMTQRMVSHDGKSHWEGVLVNFDPALERATYAVVGRDRGRGKITGQVMIDTLQSSELVVIYKDEAEGAGTDGLGGVARGMPVQGTPGVPLDGGKDALITLELVKVS